MSASPNDVAFGCDVVPTAQWASITSLRPQGATSLGAKRITSFLRKQKHHFFTARQDNYGITHYTLQGKAVCKKDEILVLFDFNMELLYGRHPKAFLFQHCARRLPWSGRYSAGQGGESPLLAQKQSDKQKARSSFWKGGLLFRRHAPTRVKRRRLAF